MFPLIYALNVQNSTSKQKNSKHLTGFEMIQHMNENISNFISGKTSDVLNMPQLRRKGKSCTLFEKIITFYD